MQNMFLDLNRLLICGRTLPEYEKFYDLDFKLWRGKSILDCPGGCSSFVAEAKDQGINALAIDPCYSMSLEEIYKTASEDVKYVMERVAATPALFKWSTLSLEELTIKRHRALDLFYKDITANRKHYQVGSLPSLPFPDRHFDLVLSGHLLFTYSDRLSYEFHLQSLIELARVSKSEVRLFPTKGRGGEAYPEMDRLRKDLEQHKITSRLKRIEYEFLRGCNEIMILN